MAENKKKVTEEKVETEVEEVTEQAPEMVEKSLLDKKEQEANDYKDKWMRSVAEFDNYKKRNALVWQEAFKES